MCVCVCARHPSPLEAVRRTKQNKDVYRDLHFILGLFQGGDCLILGLFHTGIVSFWDHFILGSFGIVWDRLGSFGIVWDRLMDCTLYSVQFKDV